ncbi:MAG: SPOR domain-containing protein [Crocinitomicaceae bacterium]|nr:SPOR domain-containing protein [Crocinitomicaceae bacterium]
MDKYLLQILKETNTIIIPGLGALTITNKTTGEIMFMPYLKHDDGKLSAHISEQEGMDENEAKNLISKYVREIQTKLDQGHSYDMYQFGSFIKNDAGDIDFKKWSGEKATSEEKETPVKAEKEPKPAPEVKKEEIADDQPLIIEDKPTKVAEPKAVEGAETPVKKTTKSSEAPAKEKKEKEKKTKAPKDKSVSDSNKRVSSKVSAVQHASSDISKKKSKTEKKTPIVPISEVPKKEKTILEKEELSANSKKLNKLKEAKKETKKKKKRGLAFYMLMSLIVIIGAGSVYVAMNYEDVKQNIPFLADKKEVKADKSDFDEMKETIHGDEDEQHVTDEGNNEDVKDQEMINEQVTDEVQDEPIQEDTQSDPIIDVPDDLPFHIIIGAFSSEANAKRLAEKMRAEGYPAIAGPGRDLTLVSIKSFATRAEANAGLAELKGVAPEGWVYEWK